MLIKPYYECLILTLYYPLQAPPYIKVIVFKVSLTPITFIFVDIVESNLLIIEAEKSDLFNVYKKLF